MSPVPVLHTRTPEEFVVRAPQLVRPEKVIVPLEVKPVRLAAPAADILQLASVMETSSRADPIEMVSALVLLVPILIVFPAVPVPRLIVLASLLVPRFTIPVVPESSVIALEVVEAMVKPARAVIFVPRSSRLKLSASISEAQGVCEPPPQDPQT